MENDREIQILKTNEEEQYNEVMKLAGYEKIDLTDSLATIGYRNPNTGDEIFSDGDWSEVMEQLLSKTQDGLLSELITRLIYQERQPEDYAAIDINNEIKINELNRESTYEEIYIAFEEIKSHAEAEILKGNGSFEGYVRVANSHRPQDYLEINAEVLNSGSEMGIEVKSVHANDIVRANSATIELFTVNFNRETLEKSLGLIEMTDSLETDYQYPLIVYSDDFNYAAPLREHYKFLNDLGYKSKPAAANEYEINPSEEVEEVRDREKAKEPDKSQAESLKRNNLMRLRQGASR